jgi:hypothetical protein
VRRGIVFAQVSLDFHDAGGQKPPSLSPDQHFAKQFAANPPWIPIVEGTLQRSSQLIDVSSQVPAFFVRDSATCDLLQTANQIMGLPSQDSECDFAYRDESH